MTDPVEPLAQRAAERALGGDDWTSPAAATKPSLAGGSSVVGDAKPLADGPARAPSAS